eukprot:15443805-Alexandrium_andersonii.AAC.1
MAASSSSRGQPAQSHAWEEEGYEDESSSDAEDSDTPLSETEQATENFLNTLLDHYFAGGLSAKALCEICWWGAKGGLGGR